MFEASRNSSRFVIALAALGLGASIVAAQNTLLVPSQHPTIQAAINAAVGGDTVLISDGTYMGAGNRALTLGGRAITIRSESGNRAACIIDCQNAARFATFSAGDTAVIESVTIRNGRSLTGNGGALLLNAGSTPTILDCALEAGVAAQFGGAVGVFGANATFDRCTFQSCQAQRGGGLYAQGGVVTVRSCSFDDNYGTNAGGGLRITGGGKLICSDSSFTNNRAWVGGAGLFVQSITPDSTVTRCTFRNNEAGLSGDGAGGGFVCDTGAGLAELSHCIFEGNIARVAAGALFRGASTTRVERVVFLNNQAQDAPTYLADGGGARIEANNAPQFVSCTFVGNTATFGGAAEVNGAPTFDNCLFAYNRATGLFENHPASGALDVYNASAAPIVTHCTFASNTSDDIGGAITVSDDGQLQLRDCILWGNSAPNAPEIRIGWGDQGNGVVTVSYSDITGGQAGVQILSTGTLNWGARNIDADPLFADVDGPDNQPGTVDDDFRLSPDSPCIDAGDPAVQPPPCDHDLVGACRVWDGDADNSARVDMGAYEMAAPRGDVVGDCQIDLADLSTLLANFGCTGFVCPGDITGDGTVDLTDLAIQLANFGTTCN